MASQAQNTIFERKMPRQLLCLCICKISSAPVPRTNGVRTSVVAVIDLNTARGAACHGTRMTSQLRLSVNLNRTDEPALVCRERRPVVSNARLSPMRNAVVRNEGAA